MQTVGVKQFCRALRRPSSAMQVFWVGQVCTSELLHGTGVKSDPREESLTSDDAGFRDLLCELEDLSQVELPDGLPPSRAVDHASELR